MFQAALCPNLNILIVRFCLSFSFHGHPLILRLLITACNFWCNQLRLSLLQPAWNLLPTCNLLKMHSYWSGLGGVEMNELERPMTCKTSDLQSFAVSAERIPREPSQPGHAPCIPSLLKLCETVSFCCRSTSTNINVPRNFPKACSQFIKCVGNSAVCSLSRLIPNILKLFALWTVLLAAMGIAASPLAMVDVSTFSMPYFRLADSWFKGSETIWMQKITEFHSWFSQIGWLSHPHSATILSSCSSYFRHSNFSFRFGAWGFEHLVEGSLRLSATSPAFLFLAGDSLHIPTNQIQLYMPKESIKIKWCNWSNCCGPLKSGAGGSLLPEFQPDFEHCENYKCRFKNIFILWAAALIQSLQVKDLLYLYSKSIMKTIKQLGVHEPHVNSVSHLNVLSAMYRLTFILTWQNFPRLDASTLLVQAESP